MQRTHQRDVAGHILENDLGFEHLNIPMEFEADQKRRATSIGWVDPRKEEGELAFPERFDEKGVIKLKKKLSAWGGSFAVEGQLQQRPSPRGGGVFKKIWWRFYKSPMGTARPPGCEELHAAMELPSHFEQIVISVDAAFKNKITGSRVSMLAIGCSGPFRFILANKTDHMSFSRTLDEIAIFDDDQKRVVGGLLAEYPQCKRVLIEDKANGSAVIDSLRQRVSGIIPIEPKGGKESRASALEPDVESGHILLPEGTLWTVDFVGEFAAFPNGARDDQVDSLSQAVIYLKKNRPRKFAGGSVVNVQ